jgi:putative phosphoribosyl transferase
MMVRRAPLRVTYAGEYRRRRGAMFDDRREAGERLAKALEKYKGADALVLAIPCGGVLVGYEVARYLDAGFSLIVVRKLPFPDEPESGFGAIAEDGSVFIFRNAAQWVPMSAIKEIMEEQRREIQRRIKALRSGAPLPEISGKTVILVDDGIAMGSTMRAAIRMCTNRKAGKIVVAAPVAGGDVAREIEKLVDETVILEKPRLFSAVAQVYRNWYDVPDREVIEIMRKVGGGL